MSIQSAAGVVLSFRRETTAGTLATNDSTARTVPYVSHGLGLSKDSIMSEELRADLQESTMRHGMRQAGGPLAFQLQTGTYSPLIEGAMRRDFTAVTTLSALTNVTAASVGAGGTFTRATGSWISDGLYVGLTIRMSGWTSTGANNNARNYTITALTATVMTVAEAVAAKTSGDSVVVSIPGRVTYLPTSGHTQASFSFEEWNPDVPRSNRFLGVRMNQMGISLKPNARADLTFATLGRDRAKNAARYFSSATVPAASVMQVGHQGLLIVGGTAVATVTGLDITLSNNMEVGQVIGSATPADVFYGRFRVSGSLTAFFDSTTYDDAFDDETEISLMARVHDDTTAGSNFTGICLPRIKLAGGSFSTQSASRVQQFEFTSLLASGTGNQATSLILQDASLP